MGIREKVASAVGISAGVAVLALGMFFSHKYANKDVSEINSSEENVAVYNIGKEMGFDKRKINTENMAYLLSDAFLYNEKNIKINAFNDKSSVSIVGAGLFGDDVLVGSNDALYQEVSILKDGVFASISPQSEEFKLVMQKREALAASIINSQLFEDLNDPEKAEFANFITNNVPLDKAKWNQENYAEMIGLALLSVIGGLLTAMGVAYTINPNEYKWNIKDVTNDLRSR